MFLNNYQHYKIKQMSSEEENNEEHEIALNWMKTPDNATGYWTREITIINKINYLFADKTNLYSTSSID